MERPLRQAVRTSRTETSCAGVEVMETAPTTRDRSGPGRVGPKRVLVAGNSRSGTTLLARMLGRNSAVLTLPELHFVEEMWLPGDDRPLGATRASDMADRLLHNARDGYHAPRAVGRYQADAESALSHLVTPVRPTDVLLAVLAHEVRRADRQLVVEQTPRNVFYLRELLDALPDTHAVVVVRDPRDVLLSQKNWWRRRFRGTTGVPWRTTLRQWADYHPLTTSLIWRGGVRAGGAADADPRVTTLRFEDLVTDPVATLSRVLVPLGIDVEPAMLDAPRISSSNSSDRSGTGVDPTTVGGFRRGLTRAELWTSQRVTGAEARRLGYLPEPVTTPWSGLAANALSLAPKTVLAVLLNRRRTRNLASSVVRRLRP